MRMDCPKCNKVMGAHPEDDTLWYCANEECWFFGIERLQYKLYLKRYLDAGLGKRHAGDELYGDVCTPTNTCTKGCGWCKSD